VGAWPAALVIAVMATTGCDPGVPQSLGPDAVETFADAPSPLVIPTYDGSGQAVEPSVIHFPDGWHGHHYWMAVSPYPFGHAALENPSILVSEDGLLWSVPEGLTNPLVLPTQGTLSDATLVYDDTSDQLWVYYNTDVRVDGLDIQSLDRLASSNGIQWSAPVRILDGDSYPIQSPSIVKVGSTFSMWTVAAGVQGCNTTSAVVSLRTSADGLDWTAPVPVDMTLPGHVIWHLNVAVGPGTGHLLSALAAFPDGAACSATSLFLAEWDGQTWKAYPTPLLAPGQGWDSQEIYRSSLLYEPDTNLLRIWYSARDDSDNEWHVGYTQGPLTIH
jgi:hypothetical protein